MKHLAIIALILFTAVGVFGQSRTAERIVDVPFSQLNIGNWPNGSIRHVINGTPGTTPCTGGGSGAWAVKVAGQWHCPAISPGVGAGDVLGPGSSVVGELTLYANTSGSAIGRSNSLTGIVSVASGVVSALASTGTGNVVRSTGATITGVDATNIFSSGTIPPARIISGALTADRCLRYSGGQIVVAADDCGTGSGGGLADPGANGIIKRTALNVTAPAIAGTDYLAPTGSGAALTGINFTQLSGSATDAQVSNNITIDSSATVTWASVNKTGSSLADLTTRSASDLITGTVAVARGGTGLGVPADDQLLVGNGTIFEFKTLPSCSNTVNDKLLYDQATNTFTCGSDQTAAGGSGITDLNGLVASVQTLSDTDDTNVTLTITSAAADHNFALGWTGTLAAGRLNANVVQALTNDTNVTGSITAQNLTLGWTGTLAKARTLATTVYTDQANDFGAFLQRIEAGANFRFRDPTDLTKTAGFDLSGITTGTNRMVTIANAASTTVIPDAGMATNFVTGISSVGVITKAQPAFTDISGSVTDAQVPDTITLTNITQITNRAISSTTGDLAASRIDDGGVAATQALFSGAAGSAGFRAITDADIPDTITLTSFSQIGGSVTDAQVPNNITIDLATLATTATTALTAETGDSATAFFSSGTIEAARLPTFVAEYFSASVICQDAGATDTYACSVSPAITSYVTGAHYRFKANTVNTGTATLNLNGLGAKTIVKAAGGITTTLADNDIQAGQWVDVVYDGTNLQMQSTLGNAGGGGGGDMVLASTQTVTGAKTFDPAKLIIGNVSTLPTPVLGALAVDTDDSKLYYGIDGTTWGEVFVAGQSTVNLASGNVTGILPVANGGTGFSDTTFSGNTHKLVTTTGTLTSGRCAEWDASGNLIQASAACGTGGGLTGTDTHVVFFDGANNAVGEAGLTYNKTTDTLTAAGAFVTTGTGAGNLEMAEGTIPSAVANRVTLAAPTDVTAAGWVLSLPTTAGTTGQFLQTNGSGVTTWATPSGSGDVIGPGSATDKAVVRFDSTTGKLIQNSVVTIADTTGDISTPGTLSSGVGGTDAGTIVFTEGTAPSAAAVNTIQLQAPVDVTTAYDLILPPASSTGFLLNTNSGAVGTLSFVGSTGSGNVVRASNATLVAPALGAATATSINGLSITTTTGTLTIASGKTLTASNTLTFTGTDASSVAFGAGGTVAYTTLSNSWADGIKQTFNPNATNAGINVGAHAGDPSTPANGDLWYDSTANELTARINGANVALGAGGGGISGLTIGTIPVADSSTSIANGPLSVTGAVVQFPDSTWSLRFGGSGQPSISNDGTTGLAINNGALTFPASSAGLIASQTYIGQNAGAIGGINQSTNGGYFFVNTTNAVTGTVDVALRRNAAGVVEVDSGTAGTFRDIKARSFLFAGSTSGTITVNATATAGTNTLTLPAVTANVATTVGTLTSGRCVEIDASGNFIQAAAACGSGGGSGDVTAAAAFGTDNVLIRSDGTGKGVQSTGITIADTTFDLVSPGTAQISTLGALGTAPSATRGINIDRNNLTGGAVGVFSKTGGADANTTPGGLGYIGGHFSAETTGALDTPDLPWNIGVLGTSTYSGTGGQNFAYGVQGQITNTSTGRIDYPTSIIAVLNNLGGGNIVEASGVHSQINQSGTSYSGTHVALFEGWYKHTGTATSPAGANNLYGLKFTGWSKATSTVTTSYGIYMDASIDLGTTRWALYSEATSPSRLTGDLEIVTASAAKLTLGVAGSSVGSVDFKNATSGTVSLTPVTGALGTTALTLPAVSGTLGVTIANGTSALGTGAIASGACATAVTTAATGTLTTDVIWWGFNGDPTAITGYSPTVNGMLTIIAYPTADNVNYKVCNNTSASVTPGAVTLNWRVVR